MDPPNGHQQHSSDDTDRTNRFLQNGDSGTHSQRERAASQPPRSGNPGFLSTLYRQTSFGGAGVPWNSSQQRYSSGLNPGSLPGLPQSVPTRSSSFSTSPNLQASLSNAMREHYRGFPSTFEDDESEALSETYDEHYVSASRGRQYAPDLTRSRSQSMAATRATPIGSPYQSSGLGQNWAAEQQGPSNAMNISGSRYGVDLQPPGSSRYGSLGLSGKLSSSIHDSSFSPTAGDKSIAGNGYLNRQATDISNMSPFMRDVGQILLDDGSAFRELWAGMHPPKDENGGGGSGTTSRRHSVSVVQPRRGIVGFSAPGGDGEEGIRPNMQHSFSSSGSGGGLLLTDDDLASSLNMLNLNNGPGPSSSQHPPPSQPSSLPIYAPLSRNASSSDRMSPYQPLNLNIPSGTSFSSRQNIRSPSESGYSGGGSPVRSTHYDTHHEPSYMGPSGGGGQSAIRMGQHIQQHSEGFSPTTYNRPSYPSPISPTASRSIHQPQPNLPFYNQPVARRSSNAEPPATIADLGKGVPLSSVPPSCPLYIVEFKAGRTDLFYCTDLSMHIRAGDLVIVEADRGKDLGKVVNDSITLAEVEAFQKQQLMRAGAGGYGGGEGSPTTPTAPGGKKDINPKMIYGKAQAHDTQMLVSKMQDEVKALQLCQSKVRQKKLPMEVIDAEYQWDRRKLTFYFVAEKRIDFRELVRELFRFVSPRTSPRLGTILIDIVPFCQPL
ncbi:hypothetical protein JAAARDRAFT_197763 [Jaapia argillacea MUCL 33604]|uniref:PSP1 C-terminal domain-containing protein n=1 Tax=Jaapia argillacea MUCL 33604 TaxID=933084 RepID=A0A067PGM7_9AGAM|nr:hypothetical protein JAAARDRAFT_197763 [Jaapia argillacea MUCL 33604]